MPILSTDRCNNQCILICTGRVQGTKVHMSATAHIWSNEYYAWSCFIQTHNSMFLCVRIIIRVGSTSSKLCSIHIGSSRWAPQHSGWGFNPVWTPWKINLIRYIFTLHLNWGNLVWHSHFWFSLCKCWQNMDYYVQMDSFHSRIGMDMYSQSLQPKWFKLHKDPLDSSPRCLCQAKAYLQNFWIEE